jgi:hypothetical protein
MYGGRPLDARYNDRRHTFTAFHATPSQALQIHAALRARHSLAMHFATFAGSDFEALEPIVELEQAKREMETGADRQGSEDEGEREGRSVGDWWVPSPHTATTTTDDTPHMLAHAKYYMILRRRYHGRMHRRGRVT